MGNFTYNTIKLEELSPTKKLHYDVLRIALRDTIMKYYRKGYDKIQDEEMLAFNANTEKKLYMALLILDLSYLMEQCANYFLNLYLIQPFILLMVYLRI